MLAAPTPEDPLEQGNIIRLVPFVVDSGTFNVKADGVQGQARLDCRDPSSLAKAEDFRQGKPLTASSVPFVLQPAMVITQSCDIDHKDQITLARIFPVGHINQDAKD